MKCKIEKLKEQLKIESDIKKQEELNDLIIKIKKEAKIKCNISCSGCRKI